MDPKAEQYGFMKFTKINWENCLMEACRILTGEPGRVNKETQTITRKYRSLASRETASEKKIGQKFRYLNYLNNENEQELVPKPSPSAPSLTKKVNLPERRTSRSFFDMPIPKESLKNPRPSHSKRIIMVKSMGQKPDVPFGSDIEESDVSEDDDPWKILVVPKRIKKVRIVW